MGIERLDPDNRADVIGVASLHETYLPESPVVMLGPRFIREFYYRGLVKDDLVICSICRADGRVVGFLSYTKDPTRFMMRGLRKHFLSLARVMFESLVARPKMLSDLVRVWRIMSQRNRESREELPRVGEALSLAVVPEYQAYVPEGGNSRVALRLFESMTQYFRKEEIDRIRIMVQPSNRAANIFYSAMGCRFDKMVEAGVAVHRFTFYLNGHTDR
jgi:ribosomal protein S18 acetylase RimI-like enzyme